MKKLNQINKISLDERVFIAGATGMVGSAIYRALLRHGYGQKVNGGEILKPNRSELNLLDTIAVSKWFKENNPSVVIIAAAKVGGIVANNSQPSDFLLENLKIQTNLIENSYLTKVKRLLFLGSSCIYPKFSAQPIIEEELLNGRLEKTNEWYAIAKISGLKLCEALRIQNNFDAISLMPTNLYGPGDNYDPLTSHVMASFIRKFYYASKNNEPFVKCWGSGNPLREFMYVDDLAEAVIFCLEKWDPSSPSAPLDKNGKPLTYLNVGTGKEISIKNLAKNISKMVNYKGLILWDKEKPDGTPRKNLNIERLANMGWKSYINLEDGIEKTLQEFEKNENEIKNNQ